MNEKDINLIDFRLRNLKNVFATFINSTGLGHTKEANYIDDEFKDIIELFNNKTKK